MQISFCFWYRLIVDEVVLLFRLDFAKIAILSEILTISSPLWWILIILLLTSWIMMYFHYMNAFLFTHSVLFLSFSLYFMITVLNFFWKNYFFSTTVIGLTHSSTLFTEIIIYIVYCMTIVHPNIILYLIIDDSW